MKFCNVKEIKYADFNEKDMVLNEPTIMKDGVELWSRSRYGFRRDELFTNGETSLTVYTYRYGSPDVVTNPEHAVSDKTFTIGICAGRPMKHSIERLKDLGLNPQFESEHEREIMIKSSDYIVDRKDSGVVLHKVEYLLVKSNDIPFLLTNDVIDAVMCYSDIWYNLDHPDYNIKYLSNFTDKLGNHETYVSLISKDDFSLDNVVAEGRKLRIFSEYKDGLRLIRKYLDQLGLTEDQVEITKVSGSVESYLHRGICDLAISIVQTGETLRINNMKEFLRLRRVYLNMWINIQPRETDSNNLYLRRGVYTSLKPKSEQRFLIVDGIDGTGKTTLLQQLSQRREIHNWLCFDRHPTITNATLTNKALPEDGCIYDHQSGLFTRDNTVVLILESDLDECDRRIKSRGGEQAPYETINAQCYFRLRYRQLSGLYGYNVLNNDFKIEGMSENDYEEHQRFLMEDVMSILNGSTEFALPALKDMTDEKFNALKTVAEGESKIVKSCGMFDIVKYKPSVYSHKRQRGGFIEGSDLERQKTTLNIELLLAKAGITHTYWCIYNGYIIAEKLGVQGAPPVEVCVKGAHVGTHKHIYQHMWAKRDRFGNKLTKSNDMYPEPIVRFDWRNPNHLLPSSGEKLIDMKHTQIFVNPLRASGKTDEEISEILEAMFPNGVPLGDYAMCDELANRFINVEESKKLVRTAFVTLSEHFAKINIRFKDVCFMPTVDGDRLYGEVSQDCGRYEAIQDDDDAFQGCVKDAIPWKSLDKDVWRAGGSSELVLEKWRRLTFLIDSYTRDHLGEWVKSLF